MMIRKFCKVVSVLVIPNAVPIRSVVKSNLTPVKAKALRDKLEEGNAFDMDADKITSFIVIPQ